MNQKCDFYFVLFFVQCIIKQILDSVFVINKMIMALQRVIVQLITPASTLINLDYITKIPSNNNVYNTVVLKIDAL